MSSMTLKKIASLLNLSISTVSRALKDHPDISASTIKRVKELADNLEYEPNANAIHLKTQNSRLFAVIVPGFSKFFYDSFISGIEEECSKNNYSLMVLQNGDNVEAEKANLKLCRLNRVAGVFACVCTETEDFKEYDKVIESGIPLLFFDKVPENTRFNRVTINDVEASMMAAKKIRESGKKKVLAIFGNKQMSISKRRYNAFNAHIKSKGLEVFYENALSQSDAETITDRYLEQGIVDSIFCMSDEILIGTMQSVQKKRPGSDSIQVVCMSDGFFPGIFHPRVTYVETSGFKLAKKAYEIMAGLIQQKKPAEEYFVEPLLVE